MGKQKRDGKGKKKGKPPVVRDRHLLYEASVQNPEADLDFFARVYRRKRGRAPRTLREDFCGTAWLACCWAARNAKNRAYGVDLHEPTLEWGRRHHLARLGQAQNRVQLIRGDVRVTREPPVDVVSALNFSYCVFKERDQLREYFEAVRGSLEPGGMFFVDAFGGNETMSEMTEKRKIPASTAANGTKLPGFTYIWNQARFNVVDHHIRCYISFKLKDGTRLERAFRYDWRLWTLPELSELMREAGFADAEVYLEGWDEEADDTDGVFRRRTYFENQDGWVGYVVGVT